MSTAEITRTAFDRVQRDLGCEFMDWEGWYWPNHFGDAIAEHHAVRVEGLHRQEDEFGVEARFREFDGAESSMEPLGAFDAQAALLDQAQQLRCVRHTILCDAQLRRRARSELVTRSGVVLRATVHPAPERTERTLEVDAYVRRLHELIERALSFATGLSQELRGLVAGIDDPLRLAYLLSSLIDMKADEKQQILEQDNLVAKLQAVATALNREIALLELKGKIETAAQQEMTDAQRQYFLRQQLKAIQEELGEGEDDEIKTLRARIAKANLPETVRTTTEREVDRLSRMTPASPEYLPFFRRNSMASTPSSTTLSRLRIEPSFSASCVSRTSPGLSSTRRTSTGLPKVLIVQYSPNLQGEQPSILTRSRAAFPAPPAGSKRGIPGGNARASFLRKRKAEYRALAFLGFRDYCN